MFVIIVYNDSNTNHIFQLRRLIEKIISKEALVCPNY